MGLAETEAWFENLDLSKDLDKQPGIIRFRTVSEAVKFYQVYKHSLFLTSIYDGRLFWRFDLTAMLFQFAIPDAKNRQFTTKRNQWNQPTKSEVQHIFDVLAR